MNLKLIAAAAAGIAVGFATGFMVANSLNKSELDAVRTELAAAKTTGSEVAGRSSMELSAEEIRKKVAEAEANPGNFEFQKMLGGALYRYAVMKQDAALLEDVAKMLGRAYDLNPDDYDVLVSYGNISFDLGQLKKDKGLNERARELYRKALEKNPKDGNVRTSLGVSYLETEDPDPKKALDELTAAVEIDPKNGKALRYLVMAYTEAGDKENAAKYLSQLKEADPEDPSIADLEKKIGG